MACWLTWELCKASQHTRCKTAEKISPVISKINFFFPTSDLTMAFASFSCSSILLRQTENNICANKMILTKQQKLLTIPHFFGPSSGC